MPSDKEPYRIARAGCEDIPALTQMVGETIVRVNSRDYDPQQIRAWADRATDLSRWEELFGSGLAFFAARDDGFRGGVAGVVSVDAQGYLHSLFVRADRQGQGVATDLLRTAVEYARGCGACRMYSEVSRTARPFFLRRGWKEIAEQKVQVGGVRMTNFRMERSLCP